MRTRQKDAPEEADRIRRNGLIYIIFAKMAE